MGGGEKPVTIYVARHGKTLFNTIDLVQGWADSPLTPDGIAIVEDLGRGLRDTPFNYVVSSDMVRARQTARIVMEQNRVSKDYQLEDSAMIRESCFGHFEGGDNNIMLNAIIAELGLPPEVLKQDQYKALFKSLVRDPYMALKWSDAVKRLDTSGMAEGGAEVKARMQTKLTEVAKTQVEKGGNVLFVSHGLSINLMLLDLDPASAYPFMPLDNAAVCKVLYENGAFHIESFNDASYVEAGRALR